MKKGKMNGSKKCWGTEAGYCSVLGSATYDGLRCGVDHGIMSAGAENTCVSCRVTRTPQNSILCVVDRKAPSLPKEGLGVGLLRGISAIASVVPEPIRVIQAKGICNAPERGKINICLAISTQTEGGNNKHTKRGKRVKTRTREVPYAPLYRSLFRYKIST